MFGGCLTVGVLCRIVAAVKAKISGRDRKWHLAVCCPFLSAVGEKARSEIKVRWAANFNEIL